MAGSAKSCLLTNPSGRIQELRGRKQTGNMDVNIARAWMLWRFARTGNIDVIIVRAWMLRTHWEQAWVFYGVQALIKKHWSLWDSLESSFRGIALNPKRYIGKDRKSKQSRANPETKTYTSYTGLSPKSEKMYGIWSFGLLRAEGGSVSLRVQG